MAWYRQSQGLWFITGLLLFGAAKNQHCAKGVDLRAPHQTSPRLQPVMQSIRSDVEHYALDHCVVTDIVAVAKQVTSGVIAAFCPLHFASEGEASTSPLERR